MFRWLDVPEQLPSNQAYRITVQYQDKSSNKTQALTVCKQVNGVDTKNWRDLLDVRSQALEGRFSWYVVVVQLPSPNADCGSGIPISPQSQVRSFRWQ